MPNCIVKMCKNSTKKVQKKDGVSYFHFPQNEIMREKWRRIIARNRKDEYFKSNAFTKVCSEHFCEDDIYVTGKGITRIKKTAIPKLKLQDSANENINTAITNLQSLPCIVKIEESEELESSSFEIIPNSVIKSPSSPDSIGSILDTPREAALGKELRLYKKRLFDRNKKIRNLQKVNKRLKNRNAVLKDKIATLKKQKGLMR